jgi:hypothetical protein
MEDALGDRESAGPAAASIFGLTPMRRLTSLTLYPRVSAGYQIQQRFLTSDRIPDGS